MSIKVVGVEKLVARFEALGLAAEPALEAAEEAIGQDVVDYARDLVPVLTGNLRDSLTFERGLGFARVYTDVVYAGQVEYGGAHNPPEPYLRPAADLSNLELGGAAAKAVVEGV